MRTCVGFQSNYDALWINHCVARIFQRGLKLCQSEGFYQIFMSFSPPVVGCLLKKGSQNGGGGGGGHRHPRTPLATPPCFTVNIYLLKC